MLRTVPALFVLVVLLLPLHAPSAAGAESGNLFTVQDVQVDVRARTASAAREQALNNGQVRALEAMLKRLTLSGDWPRLPPAGPGLATSLVSALEINNERISANRYQAALTVSFDASGIRGLLRRADIPFSEARYKPVLILPVYASGGLLSLWTDNPWRSAWEQAEEKNGLIPYVILDEAETGDSLVSADTAMTLPDSRVVRIRRQYGVANVIAVRAEAMGPSGGPRRLAVRVRDYGKPETDTFQATIRGSGESMEALAKQAVEDVQIHLEDEWKMQTLARFDERNRMTVRVPLQSLAEWHRVRSRLENNLLVDRVEILRLTRDRADLRLHYLGDATHLRVSLSQTNLSLERVSEDSAVDNAGQPADEPVWQLRASADSAR